MLGTVIFKVCFVTYVFATLSINAEENKNKLPVTLFYEALCPGCQEFIIGQLHPSMRVKNRLPYADLKLVPFGNGRIHRDNVTNQLVVECQHGVEECKRNALHACILENAQLETALDVITCLEAGSALSECATQYKMDLKPVDACKSKRSNAEILEKYAKETEAFNLPFVPAIAIDNVFDNKQQDGLEDHFDLTFCQLYAKKFGQKLDGCPKTIKNDEEQLKTNRCFN